MRGKIVITRSPEFDEGRRRDLLERQYKFRKGNATAGYSFGESNLAMIL
jgi:hypothetical protein